MLHTGDVSLGQPSSKRIKEVRLKMLRNSDSYELFAQASTITPPSITMSDEYESTSHCASCDEYLYDDGERSLLCVCSTSKPLATTTASRDKIFDSAGGLQVHIDYAAVHPNDSDEGEDEDENDYKEREDG
ncbi:hypothetical protein E1B28_002964 [Marasmius oreades]|uniref:Uncharacterized protein n=1 Tax=Marasmius oreades TaxID=181124 RepID=A0A9P7RLK6_9AGAR|nr:uncharacterized protein E1B28_002964 [Marasmius oreades]KAG7085403.1 hypothetical protein E1B28_002964 [Marasmius oreades]